MPIYEWCCGRCGLVFEGLATLGERRRPRRCPDCKAIAERAVSSFAIAAGGDAGARELESLTRPVAPPIPPAARFCWMSDQAAERFAAHRTGRGAEYDDRQARVKELREQRGLPASKPKPSGGRARTNAHRH